MNSEKVITKAWMRNWNAIDWQTLGTFEFSTGMEEHKFLCNYLRDHPEVSQLRYENQGGSWYQHRSENYEPD